MILQGFFRDSPEILADSSEIGPESDNNNKSNNREEDEPPQDGAGVGFQPCPAMPSDAQGCSAMSTINDEWK